MTKKHFQRLAYELMQARRTFVNVADPEQLQVWRDCVGAVADACKQSNVNFDRDRFIDACNANDYAPSMHGR